MAQQSAPVLDPRIDKVLTRLENRKISDLRAKIDASGRQIDLEVDGGVNGETAPLAVAAGADVLVAGTAVFTGGADAYADNIARLKGA